MFKVARVKYEDEFLSLLNPFDLKKGEIPLVSIRKPVRRLFGVLKKRNPRVRPEDVERAIEEIEGSL
jgi:predicted DNA-binding antitoxin AbrB/MazE fold protein